MPGDPFLRLAVVGGAADPEEHVVLPLSRGAGEDALDELRRRLVIAAWLIARSEVLELEVLYRRHATIVSRVFSASELAALPASFGEAGRGGSRSACTSHRG